MRLIDKTAAMAEFKQESGFGEAISFLDQNPLPDVLLVRIPGIPNPDRPASPQEMG